MADDLILEITDRIDSAARLRDVIDRHAGQIARSVEALGLECGAYLLSIDFTSALRHRGLSLVGACQVTLSAIATVEPLPVLAGIEGSTVRRMGDSSMTLRIRDLDDEPAQPAGFTLVDERLPLGNGKLGIGLSSDIMARPDAEYAISVEVPRSGDDRNDWLLRGLDLARGVAYRLPAEPGAAPNLVQLSVRMADDETANTARVRVWRLGFMKVPSRTRLV